MNDDDWGGEELEYLEEVKEERDRLKETNRTLVAALDHIACLPIGGQWTLSQLVVKMVAAAKAALAEVGE